MSAGIRVTVTQTGHGFSISIVSDKEKTSTRRELLVADAINKAVTVIAEVSKSIVETTTGGETR